MKAVQEAVTTAWKRVGKRFHRFLNYNSVNLSAAEAFVCAGVIFVLGYAADAIWTIALDTGFFG